MKIEEYNKIKELNYLEYCDYLQKKYGIGLSDYFTTSWNKNPKVTRTKEGLLAHHKYEDHAIMLSNINYAKNNPFEWQKKENIVYCDYLEHLLLHILICENPSVEKNVFEAVGIGGVINYLAPELNDLYSGFTTKQAWRKNCHDKVKEDKKVYFLLIKRFKEFCRNHKLYQTLFQENWLHRSFNEDFGLWSAEKNEKIYKEITEL